MGAAASDQPLQPKSPPFTDILDHLKSKYRFEYTLGCGGFGAVVAARIAGTDQYVTIKMVDRKGGADDRLILSEITALVDVQRYRPAPNERYVGDRRAYHFPKVYEVMKVGYAHSPQHNLNCVLLRAASGSSSSWS